MSANPFEYTFKEFQDHLAAQLIVRNYEYVTRQGRQVKLDDVLPSDSFEASAVKTWDYFNQIYPKGLAMEKGALFMSMCHHIGKNLEKYCDARLAVDGSDESGALLSDQLLRAVHNYFTGHKLADMPDDDSVVVEIIELANTTFKDAAPE